MKNARWIGFFVVAAAVATASMSDAARETVSGEIDVPGIDESGNVDFYNTGTGLGKLTVNTRNGRASASVRGSAPNESGRGYRFRTRDFDIALSILSDFTGMSVDSEYFESFRGASYRVSRRGRVSGSARGRFSESGLEYLAYLLSPMPEQV